jgi:hypothetical protein
VGNWQAGRIVAHALDDDDNILRTSERHPKEKEMNMSPAARQPIHIGALGVPQQQPENGKAHLEVPVTNKRNLRFCCPVSSSTVSQNLAGE